MKQDQPTTVKIELVEGCNLRCAFCAIAGIRDAGPKKHFEYMTGETLSRIVDEMARLRWTARVELAMHGEPTLHPELALMVAIIRGTLPKSSIMMTTNGGGLLRSPGPVTNMRVLFNAGLNILAFDDYKAVNIGDKVRGAIKGWHEGGLGFDVFYYPQDRANPRASPYTRAKALERRMVVLSDISHADTASNVRGLHNTGGVSAPPNASQEGKRCARPFRELAFRWDGSVGACCNDWRGVIRAGNINDDDIEYIWDGPVLQALRKFMYSGERWAAGRPCAGCDATSKRVGLLPDRMGKRSLPSPSQKDLDVLEQSRKRGPYTKAVLRPWEVK